jgi:hypothetical protein
MSEWQVQREAFLKLMVTKGIGTLEEVDRAFYPFGHSVPENKIQKWFGDFLTMPKAFSTQRRYVNRFKVGADPEFVFEELLPQRQTNPFDDTVAQLRAIAAQRAEQTGEPLRDRDVSRTDRSARHDAKHLKLKQGQAFGADNNGRLAEIRPYPSRSAIEVCASILATFRWMVVLYPATRKFRWVAGAFQYGDGLGGHVHFGRKRPNRAEEVKALDSISDVLVKLGIFPTREVTQRRQGDAFGNSAYGQNGDIRLQTHGYEYRTWPSWLDSPELAFLTITLSKLAVHDPELLRYENAKASSQRGQQVKNLLSYYKNLDDDARLCLFLLDRGVPQHIGGDFKSRWGLADSMEVKSEKISVIPPAICPSEGEVKELFDALLHRTPLQFVQPKPTWSPVNPPEGYVMCIDQTDTIHQKGLGEMIWNLCTISGAEGPVIRGVNAHWDLQISEDLWTMVPRPKDLPIKITQAKEKRSTIYVSNECRENPERRKAAEVYLLGGGFPLWRVQEAKTESFSQWKAFIKKQPPLAKTEYEGKVLFDSARG